MNCSKNGNYSPENCKWSTPTEQARNRRSNVCLMYEGKRLILTELASMVGINPDILSRKLKSWILEEESISKGEQKHE